MVAPGTAACAAAVALVRSSPVSGASVIPFAVCGPAFAGAPGDGAARFEADRWSGEDCGHLAGELARAAKACAAASARAAARAVECGHGDVEWVARTSGATPAQARESLATTRGLVECPATSDA